MRNIRLRATSPAYLFSTLLISLLALLAPHGENGQTRPTAFNGQSAYLRRLTQC